MPYLSSENIFARLLPLEMDINGDEKEANLIIGQFEKIPELVNKMEQEVRQSNANTSKAIKSYHDNLLRVAANLLAMDNLLAAGAAIKIATLVIGKGGDAEWCERIFVEFDKDFGMQVGALSEMKIPQKGSEDETKQEFIYRIVSIVFEAASLIPASAAAEKIHRRAGDCLTVISRHNLMDYHQVIKSFAPLCMAFDKYPGAAMIAADSYDTMVSDTKTYFDQQKEARSSEMATAIASCLMSFDAFLMSKFHDVPLLGDRAFNAFCEHWKVSQELNASHTRKTLGMIAEVYKKGESFNIGSFKLLRLIEDLYQREWTCFSKEIELPTQPMGRSALRKPLALLN